LPIRASTASIGMFRREGLASATALAAAWICFAQTPDDLRTNLASGQPRDIAWAAYSAARQGRQDLIPNLAALVVSHQAGSRKGANSVPPEVAASEAVADALIQLEASLPAATIMHLYPQFPAQTIILLSRSPDSAAALLEIFRTTHSGDLWLAAGNLLAARPPVPPGFARALLSGIVANFVFWVVPQSDKTEYGDGRSGCASDFLMVPDKAFADWPKTRMYQLATGDDPRNVFAPGIHPVGFTYWVTTDYRDESGTDSDCSPGKDRPWRTGLLAELLGKLQDDLPIDAETQETIHFRSAARFRDYVENAVEEQSRGLQTVVEGLVRSGALSREDAAGIHLKCRIEVRDERPQPRAKLPPVEGKWCTPAPPE
jgi:hypothetical protein